MTVNDTVDTGIGFERLPFGALQILFNIRQSTRMLPISFRIFSAVISS